MIITNDNFKSKLIKINKKLNVMNSSSNNSISMSNDNALDNNCFSSKLRRLKIQESVLSANVNKCFLLNNEENNEKIKYDNDMQLKKYFSKLKDTFREVNHLFEDIKLKTNDQEFLDKSDIDELKKNILELETKIRTAKKFLTIELQNLRNDEIILTEKQEISETPSHHGERKVKGQNIPQIKAYKEIIPSPVRAMIHSPFRCLEVQQLQDFMKNSTNRYGGWNEYSHNIFVQTWNKYYGVNNTKSIEAMLSQSHQNFKEEVLHKIPGVNLDSIDTHIEWYSQYLHLKLNQQKALNKWKENKRKIKRTQKVVPLEIEESKLNKSKSPINTRLCRNQNHGHYADENISNKRNPTFSGTFTGRTEERNMIFRNPKLKLPDDTTTESTGYNSAEVQSFSRKIDLRRLLRPTKQWLLKQESEKEIYDFNKSVEAIAKLRIPTWRLNLAK